MSTIFSIGQMNKLSDAFERNGWTSEDVNRLNRFPRLGDLKRVVRRELIITKPDDHWKTDLKRRWRMGYGIIHFSVISNGRTAEEWIAHFEAKKVEVFYNAKDILMAKDKNGQPLFKPTNNVKYGIAVIPGFFWEYYDRTNLNVRQEGEQKRGWARPEVEIGCLIRDAFTDSEIKEMGLESIITMHEPIRSSTGSMILLNVEASFDRLDDHSINLNGGACDGFAFLVSEAPL